MTGVFIWWTGVTEREVEMNERRAFWNLMLNLGPFLFAGLMFVGVALTKACPVEYLVGLMLLYVAGLCLFLKAKLSLIKSGRMISFGSSHMTSANKKLYTAGYLLMGLGTVLVLAFLSVTSLPTPH
jgi:hypothetical protein